MNTDHSKHHHHDENCSCGCHDDHPESSHQPEQHHHLHHPITVKIHDTSLVGSYKFDIDTSFEESETILDGLLKQVSQQVTALGGIIGHIKALLNAQGNSCMFSITEDESDKHRTAGSSCHVEGVAIVFGILPEQLERILNKAFNLYLD
ncbi:MAG: hypothetical protein KJ779_12855 [Firmicutes bacterium]|nr:hypothetical protein [Bacillota bacterium]